MGNRKLPFGYKMQRGEIILHPEESPYVSMIFEQYLQGISFRELAEMMHDKGVPYDEGKPWNKNMIARILENERYTGQSSYPATISPEQFSAVALMCAKKKNTVEKTAAQKQLRRIYGARITSNIEQQVISLLNGLVEHPELIHVPTFESRNIPQITILQQRLDSVLAQQPIDEVLARQLIREIASAEYDAVSPAEYETEKIKMLLLASKPSEELDEMLLRKCVEKVLTDKRTVSLKLRNGQIIERGALQ